MYPKSIVLLTTCNLIFQAAVKHAAAQAQIEQFEQDIARQKLKHQLEIKVPAPETLVICQCY